MLQGWVIVLVALRILGSAHPVLDVVLAVADAYQQATDFHVRRPPIR